MGAPKGHPRYGGRQKGTPNKKNQELFEKCRKAGVDPFEEMLKIVKHCANDHIRIQALRELCQYLYPKRKALELDGVGEEGGIRIIVEDYTKK